MGDLDRALGAYERALIVNSQSWGALTMAAHVCRCKEDYGRVSPVSNPPPSLSPLLSPSLAPYLGACMCLSKTTRRPWAVPVPVGPSPLAGSLRRSSAPQP